LEGKPPANVVIPWGAGKLPRIKPIYEKYRLKAACIAAVSLIKGIAKLSGMSVIDVPGATGDIDTDTLAKADAALRAIKTHDLVFLHVEGPDEASHDGNIKGKISIIEKIDSMVGRIKDNVDLDEASIVLLADHVTSIRHRKHTGDPVPLTIASTEVVRDCVKQYNEKAAYKGGLGRIQGRHIMPLILNLMCRSENLGG
jgi:2,3-bisphosphoglycerate-independent phosphoglycerate mutase